MGQLGVGLIFKNRVLQMKKKTFIKEKLLKDSWSITKYLGIHRD